MKCGAVCQDSQAEHRQQPLLAHDVTSTPWTKMASNVFQIKGDNYLLVSDYHSKFYIVEKMHSTTSIAIANKSAQWFSMFGPPLEIVTDNGPQYVGQPREDMCSKWNINHTMYEFHLRPRGSNGMVAVHLSVVVWPVHSTYRAAVLMPLAGLSPLLDHKEAVLRVDGAAPYKCQQGASHHPTLGHA